MVGASEVPVSDNVLTEKVANAVNFRTFSDPLISNTFEVSRIH